MRHEHFTQWYVLLASLVSIHFASLEANYLSTSLSLFTKVNTTPSAVHLSISCDQLKQLLAAFLSPIMYIICAK